MWHKNNKILSLVFVGLLAVAVGLGLSGESSSSTSYEIGRFTIKDTALIDEVLIEKPGENIRLTKNKGTNWSVNGRFGLDDHMRRLMLAMFQQIQVKRPVSESLQDSVVRKLKENGILVKVLNNGGQVISFLVYGNESREETYFLKSGEETPYLMAIPGYDIFLARLFSIGINEWRDKTLFACSPQNLKNLTVNYSRPFKQANNVQDLKVDYQYDFFGIEGIKNIDSAKLINYLSRFRDLRADRFLQKDEKLPPQTRTLLTININAVDTTESATLEILDARIQAGPDSMSVMHAAYSSRFDEPVLISTQKVKPLLVDPETFEKKDTTRQRPSVLSPTQ